MVPAWTTIAERHPHHGDTLAEGDVAGGKRVRDMEKVVVSTTLEHAGPRPAGGPTMAHAPARSGLPQLLALAPGRLLDARPGKLR